MPETYQLRIEAVKARREGRPDPIPRASATAKFRVSPRVTVSVRHRGEDKLTVLQALRAAVKMAQADMARGTEEAA